jgi:multiple sugar transport system substrate-binding protein
LGERPGGRVYVFYLGNIMKTNVTRRTVIKSSTALATAGALTGPALLEWANAWPQTAPWKPEKGAQLSLLRAKSFVPAEDDACVAVMNAFTKATGVKVNIIRESDDDVQPKALVAANAGAGPDLFWGLFSLPHLFPQKCLDVSDVADYLGKRYGGWVASAIPYGKGKGDKWIDLPIVWVGNVMNYRKSSLKQAGFSRVPATTEELLEYAKATKKNNRPGGFALGRSPQDGNSWVHWCLWAHGGYAVDMNDKVIINSPETEKALNYAKQLYENMIPGVASWNDASNNKAFLGNEIHWTSNTISIYVAAAAESSQRTSTLALTRLDQSASRPSWQTHSRYWQ